MNDKIVGLTKLKKHTHTHTHTKSDRFTAYFPKSVVVQFVLLYLLIKLSYYVLLSYYIMFVKQLINFYAILCDMGPVAQSV